MSVSFVSNAKTASEFRTSMVRHFETQLQATRNSLNSLNRGGGLQRDINDARTRITVYSHELEFLYELYIDDKQYEGEKCPLFL